MDYESVTAMPHALGLTHVDNDRQLGGYVNKEGRKIRMDRLLRTANLHNLQDDDIALLTDKYHVKTIIDFRTRLEDAQHYAADWSDTKMKQDFLASMQFTHDEAKEETPVSACNVTLSVCPTVRIICAYGVSNFMNFWNGKPLKKLILADAFNFDVMAF